MDTTRGTSGVSVTKRERVTFARATVLLVFAGALIGQTNPPPKQPQVQANEAAEQDQDQASAPRGRVPTPEERMDRVKQLMRGIDPKQLNLSGAELDYEIVGDKIILRGNEKDLDLIEMLVEALKSTAEKKELRVVQVTERDANEIARNVQEAVRKIGETPNRPKEELPSIQALGSNILLVSAVPSELDAILQVIEGIEKIPNIIGKIELMTFEVKHRKASDVAKELEKVLEKVLVSSGVKKEQSKLQIIPNNANNTIIVNAPEREKLKIQSILDSIDVEPSKGWGEIKLTVFPLLHSKPKEMADVIKQLLEQPKDKEKVEEMLYRLRISKALPTGEIVDLPPIDLQRQTKIIPDEGSNSLIVATIEENVGPFGELIRMLDGVPLAEEVGIKVFPLRFADAESLQKILKDMFDQGKKLPKDPDGSGESAAPAGPIGKALVYEVSLQADVRTNTLIASGRQEQLQLVADLVAQLDLPANALKFPLRLIPLEHTDASKLGEIITDLFEKRFEAAEKTGAGKAALERERVFLSTDIRTNSLIISCSQENYDEIVTIIKQLDTKPARLFDQIRLVRCQRLNATDVKDKIDELWKRKADLRKQEELMEDLPVVAVDGRSNSLIIASNIEDYEEIKRLVETLETQPVIEGAELYKLQFADAAALQKMLDELFQGMAGQSEAFKAPTIIADPRGNALVVAGTRDALERAEHLVKRLDVAPGPLTAIFKVYPLTHASASQLAKRVQELFDSRSKGDEQTRTPIVVTADEASNALVTSASRDDHEIITDLLAMLDKPSTLARQFEIFPLKFAKAATVAEKLEGLFKSQGEGGGSGRADAIASQADERSNSVIVWASPAQMENIKEVIGRLDTVTPAVEMMVRVVQLKQALAKDFADLLQRALGAGEGGDEERAVILAFSQKLSDGKEAIRKLLQQNIKIEADARTNSLMVVAPMDSMAMLEAMIRDFDTIRPVRSELRLFPLVNSSAEQMVEQLGEIFSPKEGGGEGEARSQLIFGDTLGEFDVASVGQELRFAADTRTNTLIAAGASVDLRMVEELVRYLDSQEAENRVTEVLITKFAPPGKIASAVKAFNDQEQSIFGEIDTEEAAMRKMDRQITIEAMEGEEEGSGNSLIIGTSRKQYQDTMAMIQALDRPEPQVRISVVIAEVTLSDTFAFGIEMAGQDLDFSLNAVEGPNGVVQGSDFDWVGGSNLGVISPLGFNFTITGEDFSFLLNAFQQDSRLEILSRPTVLVRNGEEGNITIANQVPYIENSQVTDSGAVTNTIGREDVGIILTATPQISPDGYVTIEMKQEISNIADENITLSEGVTSPIFQTREVTTNVTVRDGETVVVGGLITSRRSEGETKVPILGDLPGIGWLFRATRVTEQKTELLIVMTVDVLRSDEDVRRMSVTERDNFVLPESIRRSHLLEGLRIVPDETLMGPKSDARPREPADSEQRRRDRELYGPKPKTYGPVVPRPKSTTTTEGPVYGPKVVRRDPSEG